MTQLPLIADGAQPPYTFRMFTFDTRILRDMLKPIVEAKKIAAIVAIPRGGLPLGAYLAYAFDLPIYCAKNPVDLPPTPRSRLKQTLVVDDNAVTGKSFCNFMDAGATCAVLVRHPFYVGISSLMYARESDEMFLFPWESLDVDQD